MRAGRILSLVLCALAMMAGCVNVKAPKQIKVDMTNLTGGGNEGDGYFYAEDVLARPGQLVPLIAHFKPTEELQKPAGVVVTFKLRGRVLGSAVTNRQGIARVDWHTRKPGLYHIRAKITGVARERDRDLEDIKPAKLTVKIAKRDEPLAVVDLDRTLVASNFFRVMTGGGKTMPKSQKVMRRLAKHFGIVYLTNRPGGMARLSKKWLDKNDYPQGPVYLNYAGQVSDNRKFKSRTLRRLKRHCPNMHIGIGDKDSDIEAYRDNNMAAYWIVRCKDKPKDMRKLAKKMRPFRKDNKIAVVTDWKQIEKGIFGGKTKTPKQFAKDLKQEAEKIERHKRKKDKDDDDDDDDEDDDEDDDD